MYHRLPYPALRYILLIGAAFNFGAMLMLLFPATVGAIASLPSPGSVFYSYLLALFVGLFGATYLWLSFQPAISRPLIGLAAIGKTGVFLVTVVCWISGDLPLPAVWPAIVDLAFAVYFFRWLRTSRAVA